MSNEIVIDLSTFDGPVYTGRPRGEYIRAKIDLNKIDSNPLTNVKVIVPDNTFSLNSSFFLGLFGPSVRASGSRDKFLNKFQFINPAHITEYIESGIERALQERSSLLNR